MEEDPVLKYLWKLKSMNITLTVETYKTTISYIFSLLEKVKKQMDTLALQIAEYETMRLKEVEKRMLKQVELIKDPKLKEAASLETAYLVDEIDKIQLELEKIKRERKG